MATIAISDFEIIEQPSSSTILEMPPMPPLGSGGHQGQLKGKLLTDGKPEIMSFSVPLQQF